MSFSIFALIHLIFAVPQPVVNWASSVKDTINISSEGNEPLLDKCLEAGIEVRYRFQMRYCRRGSFWFDQCQDQWDEIKTIKYDPIKESYLVQSDRIGDEIKPSQALFSSKEEAIKMLSTIENADIDKISRGEYSEYKSKLSNKNNQDDQEDLPRTYIGIKIVSDCKGSVGSTMLDISYYLTFGLVKVSRFDSGWVAFYLDP